MGQTLSEQLLKRKYSGEKPTNIALMPTSMIGGFSRPVNPDGDSFTSFIQLSGGVGWSGTRSGARAVANQGGSRGNGAFQQIKNAQGCLKGETAVRERDVKRADSGDAAAMRAMAAAVDGHLEQLGQQTEWMVTSSSEGLFVCSGTISSGVVTITSNAEHCTRLMVDMILVASASNGTTGSLLGSGSQGFVTKVGRSGSSPTFTVSATSGGSAGTPAGWTGTMFFFLLGIYAPSNGGAGIDAAVDGDTSGFFLDTLTSWCPAAAPGATLFKTMDRTVDERLGGVRQLAAEVASLNTLQRIEKLAVLGRSRFGWGNESKVCAYIHTTRFNECSQLLQRSDTRDAGFSVSSSGKGRMGYKYIEISCVTGDFRIEEGPMIEPDICWMLDTSDWELHSAAGWPSVIEDDKLRWVRDPNTDTFVLQYSGYGSLRTKKPNRIARCPLS